VIDFLTAEDLLAIHAAQIGLYGGAHGVRDRGLLESAVAQPQATSGGEYCHGAPFEMAAASLFHIVRNHPFVDGNKRTGLVATLAFLELNGIEINAPGGSLYELTISVTTGQAGKAQIAEFLRSHAR